MQRLLFASLLVVAGCRHSSGSADGPTVGPQDGGGADGAYDAGASDGAMVHSDGGMDAGNGPPTGDFCLSGNWCWQRPTLFGTSLLGVWGSSPSDVWAVGVAGTIVRYDGTKWALVQSGTGPDLRAVWGSSASDVWFVGAGGTILHYDGTAISSVASGTTNDLSGVYGGGATNVFAVGDGDTRLQWDGTSWTTLPTLWSGVMYPPKVVGVWTNGGDVFTVGDDPSETLAQRNGGTWAEVSITDSGSSAPTFTGVWGSADSDVWITGGYFANGLQHWDGMSWTLASAPGDSAAYGSTFVTGTSSTDVWFFGGQNGGARFDGTSWHDLTELQFWYPTGGWVHPSGAGWVVGGAGVIGQKTTPTGAFSFVSGVADGVYGGLSSLAVIADDDVWAVGRFVTTHWNGTSWTDVAPANSNEEFTSVWASGPNDVWAVAWGYPSPNNLQHWDGTKWNLVDNPGDSDLNAVWGTGPDDIWVASEGGTSAGMHWDGMAWSTANPAPGAIHAFDGTGPNDVWAVGEGGRIVHWNGTAWTAQTSGTMNDLESVLVVGAADVWAAGNGSTLLHFTGASWTPVTTPAIASDINGNHGITGLTGTSTDLWASASDGHVFHYDGSAWTTVVQSTIPLSTIARTPSGALLIAGANGGILRRAP